MLAFRFTGRCPVLSCTAPSGRAFLETTRLESVTPRQSPRRGKAGQHRATPCEPQNPQFIGTPKVCGFLGAYITSIHNPRLPSSPMPQSLAKILVQLVFSTKHRRPILPPDPFIALHKYARGIFDEQKCHMIEMNNVSDHVHILFDLHRTASISNVVMHVKKGSSRWLKEQAPEFQAFDWQDGYGAFSLGLSQRDDAIAYIRDQQNHHRQRSFQDEFRDFLRRYEVEFDERYVWD
jgi:putative transposase